MKVNKGPSSGGVVGTCSPFTTWQHVTPGAFSGSIQIPSLRPEWHSRHPYLGASAVWVQPHLISTTHMNDIILTRVKTMWRTIRSYVRVTCSLMPKPQRSVWSGWLAAFCNPPRRVLMQSGETRVDPCRIMGERGQLGMSYNRQNVLFNMASNNMEEVVWGSVENDLVRTRYPLWRCGRRSRVGIRGWETWTVSADTEGCWWWYTITPCYVYLGCCGPSQWGVRV